MPTLPDAKAMLETAGILRNATVASFQTPTGTAVFLILRK